MAFRLQEDPHLKEEGTHEHAFPHAANLLLASNSAGRCPDCWSRSVSLRNRRLVNGKYNKFCCRSCIYQYTFKPASECIYVERVEDVNGIDVTYKYEFSSATPTATHTEKEISSMFRTNVVEVIDGFVGQVTADLPTGRIIVWQSDAFEPGEHDEATMQTEGQKKATEAANAAVKTAVANLFKASQQ